MIGVKNLAGLMPSSRFLAAVRSGLRSRKLFFMDSVASLTRLGIDLPEVSGDWRKASVDKSVNQGTFSHTKAFPLRFQRRIILPSLKRTQRRPLDGESDHLREGIAQLGAGHCSAGHRECGRVVIKCDQARGDQFPREGIAWIYSEQQDAALCRETIPALVSDRQLGIEPPERWRDIDGGLQLPAAPRHPADIL